MIRKQKLTIASFGKRLLSGVVSRFHHFIPKLTRSQRIQKLLKITLTSHPVRRVLVWEPGGMTGLLDISAVISTALRLRGVDVHLVMCDGAFSGCILREQSEGVAIGDWPKRCPDCIKNYRSEVDSFALPYSGLGDFVPISCRTELRKLAQSIAIGEIFNFQYKSVDVGRFAASSTARNLKGKSLDGEDELLREYFYSSLICTEAAIVAIDYYHPDFLLMSQAFNVDWGPALSIAIKRGIPVVILTSGYLPAHFYFSTIHSLNEIDAHRLSADGWQKRLKNPLSQIENENLDSYLSARYTTLMASDISISASPLPKDDLTRQLKLPEGRPVWCLFTHINWDEVFIYGNMVFETVNNWVLDSIRAMEVIRDVSWLIKIHPAEYQEKQRFGVGRLISEHFPHLPEHIRLIPSESPINTYGLFSILDGGVTVFGTVGLELATLGKPVILAGTPHYGGKGFTHEGTSREEYLHLLTRAGHFPPLSVFEHEKARQYAYSYFLERQFPLNIFSLIDNHMGPIVDTRLEQLLPGHELAIDTLCARFMDGGDFILPSCNNHRPLEKPFQDRKSGNTK